MVVLPVRISTAVVLIVLASSAPAPAQDLRALGADADRAAGQEPGRPDTPALSERLAFSGASAAAGTAGQEPTLLNLTATMERLIRRVDHGDIQQVAAEALRDVQYASETQASTPFRFRVGMFFEDVTLNLLNLFSTYWAGARCDPSLVGRLENELQRLPVGRGNGVVFGRGALAAIKKRCGP
jgi:hypothetical protein